MIQETAMSKDDKEAQNEFTYKALFTKYRRVTFMGLFIAVIQQFCGLNAIMVFSNLIFVAGLSDPDNDSTPQILTTLVGAFNVIFTLLSLWVVPRFRQKTLLIFGMIMMGLTLLIYAILGYAVDSDTLGAKVMLLVWVFPFAVSVGALAFAIIAEILPDSGTSLAFFINWMSGFLVVQFFLPIANSIEFHGAFLIFAIINFVAAIIIMCFYIDTAGKSKVDLIAEYCGIKDEKTKQQLRESIRRDSRRQSMKLVEDAPKKARESRKESIKNNI